MPNNVYITSLFIMMMVLKGYIHAYRIYLGTDRKKLVTVVASGRGRLGNWDLGQKTFFSFYTFCSVIIFSMCINTVLSRTADLKM